MQKRSWVVLFPVLGLVFFVGCTKKDQVGLSAPDAQTGSADNSAQANQTADKGALSLPPGLGSQASDSGSVKADGTPSEGALTNPTKDSAAKVTVGGGHRHGHRRHHHRRGHRRHHKKH